jgi:hypothetical protein
LILAPGIDVRVELQQQLNDVELPHIGFEVSVVSP